MVVCEYDKLNCACGVSSLQRYVRYLVDVLLSIFMMISIMVFREL